MYLEDIKYYQFRNFLDLSVNLSPGVNLLIGKNGQGKTNFIEGIYFLSTMKSFRIGRVTELPSWGKEASSVFGHVNARERLALGVSIEGGVKAAYLKNEKVKSLSDYLGQFVVVSFSPSDLALVKGGPSLRRRFFDKHLVDYSPALIHPMMEYQRALRHKAELVSIGTNDNTQLDIWDRILAETALEWEKARLHFIAKVEGKAKRLLIEFTKDATLDISLKSNVVSEKTNTEEEVFSSFLRFRSKELQQRSCIAGPQRDEILILLNDKSARTYASQGETRTVVLCIKLAVMEVIEEHKGEPLVLLLDDVDSELDKDRKKALFEAVLGGRERQLFITSANPEIGYIMGKKPTLVLNVEDGKVKEH